GKRRQGGGDVIGCPVTPGAGRRVGIIAEKGKTARTSRRIAPVQRRRQVLAIAREASRDRRPVGKGSRIQPHALSPRGDCWSHYTETNSPLLHKSGLNYSRVERRDFSRRSRSPARPRSAS